MARTRWRNLLRSFARPAAPSEIAFPPDFLASLERLRVAALKALGGGLREGHRLGAYKGGQLEFHGHRSYTPGDELRYVDWNSYARLGRPYVKEFAREEAGVLHLLIDGTPSMLLGAPTKWTFARRLAALFAHVAVSSRDAVYLHVLDFAGEVTSFPARGRRAASAEYIAFLETPHPRPLSPNRVEGRGAPLLDAATHFLRSGPLRGGVIVISDFWLPEQDAVTAVSRLSAAGFDVSALHVLAPDEIAPLLDSDVLVRSAEEEGEAQLYFSSELTARYGEEFEKHRQAIEELVRRRGGSYLLMNSAEPLEKALVSMLRQRRWLVS